MTFKKQALAIFSAALLLVSALAHGGDTRVLHAGQVKLESANSLSNAVTLTVPATVTTPYNFTYPAAPGTTGQALYTTDNVGTLGWLSVFTNPMTTTGDLLYALSGGAPARLAAGSSTQVLHSGAVPSWGAVSLTTDVSGTLPVGNGGTGLTAGTSGGVPYYSATNTLASSGVLAADGVVLGGGAGATPTTTTAGSADQVLRIPGAGGSPAFGAVDLSKSAAVTSTLAVGNGGTGLASGTSGGVLAYTASGTLASSGALTANAVVVGGGAGVVPAVVTNNSTGTNKFLTQSSSATPAWATILAADVPSLDASKITSGQLAVANGGTALSALPTSAAASTFAAWNANSNLPANNFLSGYTTTATAAATTTLTVASTYLQYFTGSTTQTVALPVVSTLVLGQRYRVVNNSSGVVTVQSSGGNTVQALAANSVGEFTAVSTSGTGAASWNVTYQTATAATVTSVDMTVPSFLSVSGNPVTTSGTLAVTLSGTALPVANGGTGLTSGTSGGVLAYTASGTLASSSALTANGVVLGGGAGAAPTSTAACTTANRVLVSGSPPSCGQITASGFFTTGAEVTQSGPGVVKSAGQLLGSNTNDSAAASYVGEFLDNNVGRNSPIGLSSGVAKDVITLTLTAGDWDVWGAIGFTFGATAAVTGITAAFSTTLNTVPSSNTYAVPNSSGEVIVQQRYATITPSSGTATFVPVSDIAFAMPTVRVTTTGTTLHLVASVGFTSTVDAYGSMFARRRR